MGAVRPVLIDLPSPLTTPRLTLRQPTFGDGQEICDAILQSYNELRPWMPWASKNINVPLSEEYARRSAANWILKSDNEIGLPLLFFEKNSTKLVGVVVFHQFAWDVPMIEIGYWMRAAMTGRGLMTEAVNACTRYAIEVMKVKRIEVRIDPFNMKARNVVERLKFIQESTFKSNRINHMNGQPTDTIIYTRHNLDNLPALEVSW